MAKKKTMKERHNEVKDRIEKIKKDEIFFETNLTISKGTVYKEWLDEMNETGSIRSETLLIFTYIESVLKDIISLLLKSKSSRLISRDVIVKILEENKTLNCYIGADIRKVFDIRDLYGHNLRKSVIEKEVKGIINTMFTTEFLKKKFAKDPKEQDWDKRHLSIQLSDIGIVLINQVNVIFTREYIDNAEKQKNKVGSK